MAYPEQMVQIRQLVDEHLELTDEPLLLAVYYASASHPGHECLFEIADNFGFNEVSEDRQLLLIEFASSERFSIAANQRLFLTLTSPTECLASIRGHWPDIEDVQRALREGSDSSFIIYKANGRRDIDEIVNMLSGVALAA